FQRLSAETVQNHIVIFEDCLEIVLSVIDRGICPKALHQVEIRCARCRRYDRANMLSQLNCEGSYTAGPRVNEKSLSFLQIRSFDQCLPSGQADERDGSRFFRGECFRLMRHVIFCDGDEFRECTDSTFVWPRIDLVAWLEPAHSRSDTDHDTSRFIP